jgi:hypothetical protein
MSSFTFSHQIERSLVSTIWHYPRFIDFVHLSLDPDLHFIDQDARIALEMISVVYWETGSVDWTSVGHALAEINAVELCGGLQGLNDIFTDDGHYPEGRSDPEPFVKEYINLMREYAIDRQSGVDTVPIRFTGGKGKIIPNRLAQRDSDPSDTGEAWIRGHRYKIRGWHDGSGLVIKFYPEGR